MSGDAFLRRELLPNHRLKESNAVRHSRNVPRPHVRASERLKALPYQFVHCLIEFWNIFSDCGLVLADFHSRITPTNSRCFAGFERDMRYPTLSPPSRVKSAGGSRMKRTRCLIMHLGFGLQVGRLSEVAALSDNSEPLKPPFSLLPFVKFFLFLWSDLLA